MVFKRQIVSSGGQGVFCTLCSILVRLKRQMNGILLRQNKFLQVVVSYLDNLKNCDPVCTFFLYGFWPTMAFFTNNININFTKPFGFG